MSVFVVLARQRWGEKCTPLTQVKGSEQRAVDIAQHIHKNGGMNRTLVVDADFKIVFKQDRRCKCFNAQYTIDGELRCEDCGRLIDTKAFTVEEYQ